MDKYVHYKIQDFAQDESFVNWVNKSDLKDRDFWDQWMSNHPKQSSTISEAKMLVQSIQFKNDPIDKSIEDKIWSNINERTRHEITVKPLGASKFKIIMPYAVAASVALLVYFNFVRETKIDTKIKTELATTSSQTLPDGSTISINADSEIRYDKASWEKQKTVTLEGEAFFEVVKGSKFTVKTANGTVKVLGTSFNIFTRDDVLEVICQSGKVAVNADGIETILTPNESVAIKKGRHLLNFDNNIDLNRSKWREALYTYRSETLKNVISDIQRQFNINIEIKDDLANKLFTGKLQMSNLDSVMHQLCWPLNYQYSMTGQKVMISE